MNQIEQDRQSLIELMQRLGMRREPRLDRLRLVELEARAEEQLRRVDEHRGPIARDAFVVS